MRQLVYLRGQKTGQLVHTEVACLVTKWLGSVWDEVIRVAININHLMLYWREQGNMVLGPEGCLHPSTRDIQVSPIPIH
jgi:hypothetical protein